MGLLDSLLGVVRAVSEAGATETPHSAEPSTAELEAHYVRDARPFEEKFREVLSSHSDVMVEQGIPVEVLEAQAGRAIYAKGGNRRLPVSFTYRLTRNGKPLYIRLWKRYEEYDYAANRQVRAYCDMNGIKVLDFFEYMPNAITYMQERIDSALAAL